MTSGPGCSLSEAHCHSKQRPLLLLLRGTLAGLAQCMCHAILASLLHVAHKPHILLSFHVQEP